MNQKKSKELQKSGDLVVENLEDLGKLVKDMEEDQLLVISWGEGDKDES